MPNMPLHELVGSGDGKRKYVEITDEDAAWDAAFESEYPPGQMKIKKVKVVDPFPFYDPQYLAACERLKICDARAHFRCFGYPAVRGDWFPLG